MPRNVGYTMSFTFTGVDNLTPTINQAERGTRRLGQTIGETATRGRGSLRELAGAYNALIVARRAATAMGAALKPAIDMELATTKLSVATGLAAGDLKRLEQEARATAAVTPFAPPEAIDAARRLNLVLRDTEQTARALTPTMSLAATFMEQDFSRAADLATKIAGGFGDKNGDVADNLDKLVAIARTTGVQVTDLDKGYTRLGLAASRLGSNFEDVTSALALAVKMGMPATMAATGLLTGVGRLSHPKIRKGLRDNLGVIVEYRGKFLDMRSILGQLYEAQKDVSDVEFQTSLRAAFGDRAVKPWLANLALMRRGVRLANGEMRYGTEIFDEQAQAVLKSQGLLKGLTDEAMKPLAMQLQILKESLGILLETIFRPLVASLAGVAEGLKSVLLFVSGFVKAHPAIASVVNVVVKVGGAFLGGVSAVLALGAALRIVAVAAHWAKEGLGVGLLGAVYRGMTGWIAYAGSVRTASLATFEMSLAQNRAMVISGAMAKSEYALRAATGQLAVSFRTLGAAVKGFMFSAGGLITIIMLLYEGLSWLFDEADKVEQGKVGKTAWKQGEEIRKVSKAAMDELQRNIEVQRGLRENVASLAKVIEDVKELQKVKLPQLSGQTVVQMSRAVEQLAQSGRFAPRGVVQMQEAMARIEKTQQMVREGKIVPEEVTAETVRAFGALSTILKVTHARHGNMVKDMDMYADALGNFHKNSTAMAQALIAAGYKSEEFKELQDKANGKLRESMQLREKRIAQQKETITRMAAELVGRKEAEKLMKGLGAIETAAIISKIVEGKAPMALLQAWVPEFVSREKAKAEAGKYSILGREYYPATTGPGKEAGALEKAWFGWEVAWTSFTGEWQDWERRRKGATTAPFGVREAEQIFAKAIQDAAGALTGAEGQLTDTTTRLKEGTRRAADVAAHVESIERGFEPAATLPGALMSLIVPEGKKEDPLTALAKSNQELAKVLKAKEWSPKMTLRLADEEEFAVSVGKFISKKTGPGAGMD